MSMAETREIFEQVDDGAGCTRLDRPFTAEEAAAQDAANRARLEKGARAASIRSSAARRSRLGQSAASSDR